MTSSQIHLSSLTLMQNLCIYYKTLVSYLFLYKNIYWTYFYNSRYLRRLLLVVVWWEIVDWFSLRLTGLIGEWDDWLFCMKVWGICGLWWLNLGLLICSFGCNDKYGWYEYIMLLLLSGKGFTVSANICLLFILLLLLTKLIFDCPTTLFLDTFTLKFSVE